MATSPSPTFGMSTCFDVYEKLKSDLEALEAAGDGEDEQSQKRQDYAAFNFIVTARHLAHDWLRKNAGRPRHALKKLGRKHPGITAALNAAQDLANGSKHFKITMYTPTTTVEDRGIFDYETWAFGPQYAVREGSYYFSMFGLARILMAYFDWIFDDTASVGYSGSRI
ncbi:hypothetical protein ACFOLJ_17965 [Rugamonas sp. CCM 8940]|uniref:hypothetical protein n=1 Tax=Rugamonas sp. CCM 8940 TaxID=2765359 RepID=UPI0018F43314|nr:hypothetical protein [Rugamonas sp. CCM 8940]MBJ7314044.1 hypothetical protein [Rugamonas sp. CCM 8940]